IVMNQQAAEVMLDVEAAASLAGQQKPTSMLDLIQSGGKGLESPHRLEQWFEQRLEPSCLRRFEEISWLTPVPPRSFIAAGRNFGRHQMESIRGDQQAGGGFHADFPTGFVKLGRSLVPHLATVKRPP